MRSVIPSALAFILFNTATLHAGENFNYSSIGLTGAWSKSKLEDGGKIDSTGFSAGIDFELPDYPLVLSGAYTSSSIDDSELFPGYSIQSTQYFIGAHLIVSPFASNVPFDILPGVFFGHSSQETKIDLINYRDSLDYSSITASILSRYRFENKLIFNTGISHARFNKDQLDNQNTFSAGLEYEADPSISLGLNQQWSSESSETQLFLKFFY